MKNLFSYRLSIFIFLLGLGMGLLIPSGRLAAQPIPVGDLKEGQYRLLQLMADSTTPGSFLNRPVHLPDYLKLTEEVRPAYDSWWAQPLAGSEDPLFKDALFNDIKIGTYDPVITNTYNSALPYGENNGAAWYGTGLNTELQGGFYLRSKFVTMTFRPHIIYTENADFETPRFIPRYQNGEVRYAPEGVLPEDSLVERIDLPFRFGPDAYTTFNLGQSSIRIHYKALEAGLSNETLWWGPGVQYALMMSNNAPGVPHTFLGTREPLELPLGIGEVEFRWMLGWPQDSKYFMLPNDANTPPHYLKAFTRIMNGLNVVYSPSFLPNFHIGVSRVIHQYLPRGGMTFKDFLAVFRPFPKPDEQVEETSHDDSHYEVINPIASAYFRWVFPESNAEFYGELYKGDHNINLRDFLMEPQHGRAYTVGLQKIIESNLIDFVKINAEINSLLPGRLDDVRPQTYYYTHKTIKQGHTNRGQILGAAIGPGSTSQYLGIEGYFNRGKVGVFAQRMVQNDQFHYEFHQRFYPPGGYKDQFRHQAKLNLGVDMSYKVGPVILNGSFVWNKHFEYGRHAYGVLPISWATRERDDVINLQYRFSLRYVF